MKKIGFILLLISTFLLPLIAAAQETELTPQAVTIAASDGLQISGDYYTPAEGETYPAVLLLHMLNGARREWNSLIPLLVENGYAVLAVDLRGHGQTRGDRDWALAEQDVQTMIGWLREQSGVSGVAIIGGSIGSTLALRGMANDEEVVTAIALSPGLNYLNITTADAIETIDERPVMLVAAHGDSPSGANTRELAALVRGDTLVMFYDGSSHGTNMLSRYDDLPNLIVLWLNTQFAAAES